MPESQFKQNGKRHPQNTHPDERVSYAGRESTETEQVGDQDNQGRPGEDADLAGRGSLRREAQGMEDLDDDEDEPDGRCPSKEIVAAPVGWIRQPYCFAVRMPSVMSRSMPSAPTSAFMNRQN